MKRESAFQREFKKKVQAIDPGCYILKNDGSNKPQGFPDLTILFSNGRWGEFECKREEDSERQPNQEYYVERLNTTGFSRFVYPENEEEVLNDIQQSFGS